MSGMSLITGKIIAVPFKRIKRQIIRYKTMYCHCDTMSWIYAHICIHTCVCVCAPIRVCVCVCIYIYIRPHTCVCTHTPHTRTHARTYIHIWQDELDSAWLSNFKC